MASSGLAEGARTLDIGSDASVTFTDLGNLVSGVVQLVEHREMPFCVGFGLCWLGLCWIRSVLDRGAARRGTHEHEHESEARRRQEMTAQRTEAPRASSDGIVCE